MLYRLLLLLALPLLLSCQDDAPGQALRALPPAVGAVSVDWGRGEAHGFGPGGNETGFYVIRLTDEGAEAVTEGGLVWLNTQDGGRLLPPWVETPVPRDEVWLGRTDGGIGPYPYPTVQAVLDQYGFGFDLPPEHRTSADAALIAPGNFYAFGPGGLVALIVPKSCTAYVFHAG